MNQIIFLIGEFFCIAGGFAITLCIFAFLANLALELWGDVYNKLCVVHKLSLSDVVNYGLCKEEFNEWLATHEPRVFKNGRNVH